MLDPLVRLVADPGASFQDVVTLCSRAEDLRLADIHVAGFLRFHVRELLDLCASDDPLAPRAFMVFSKKNQSLFEGLSEGGAIYCVCESVLSQSPSRAVLSRVCGLFAAAISAGDQSDPRISRILGLMLKHLPEEEPGVEDAIKVILSDERYRVAQNHLVRSGFGCEIVSVIGASLSILRIIATCAHGPIGRALIEAGVVKALVQTDNHGADFWCAVATLASRDEIVADFDELVSDAVTAMSEPYSVPERFRIHAIDFVAAMARHESAALCAKVNMTFVEVLVRLAVQFQDCSNLQAAVFRLVEAGLKWSKCRSVFESYFLPFLIMEAGSKYRTATSANCAALLTKLTPEMKNGLGGKKAQVLIGDCRRNFLVSYEARMKAPYGGKIPGRTPGRWHSENSIF